MGLEPGVANGKIHRAMAVPQIINFDSKFVHRIGIFYNLRPAVAYEEKRFTVQVRVVVLDFSLDRVSFEMGTTNKLKSLPPLLQT